MKLSQPLVRGKLSSLTAKWNQVLHSLTQLMWETRNLSRCNVIQGWSIQGDAINFLNFANKSQGKIKVEIQFDEKIPVRILAVDLTVAMLKVKVFKQHMQQ